MAGALGTAASSSSFTHVHAALPCAATLRPGNTWGKACHPSSQHTHRGQLGRARKEGPGAGIWLFTHLSTLALGQCSRPHRADGGAVRCHPPHCRVGAQRALCSSVWSHSPSGGAQSWAQGGGAVAATLKLTPLSAGLSDQGVVGPALCGQRALAGAPVHAALPAAHHRPGLLQVLPG